METISDNVGQKTDEAQENSSDGMWLYRDKDLLIGPVPTQLIIDRLYSGEVTNNAVVADEDDEDEWRPIKSVEEFSVHVAKAQAHLKVLEEKKNRDTSIRRKKIRSMTVFGMIAAGIFSALFATVVWLVTHKPWFQEDEVLADLVITANPPVISIASAEDFKRGEDIFIDVHVEAPPPPPPPRKKAQPRRRVRRRPPAAQKTAVSAPQKTETKAETRTVHADADGLATETTFDLGRINSEVERQSSTLHPCLREEHQRSGFTGSLNFSFSIHPNGRIQRVWIDERRLRGGELNRCFERVMMTWRFSPFTGESPTINHSFHIGN